MYDAVRLLVDVASEYRSDVVLTAGTEGTVVEAFDKPSEGYAVDFAPQDGCPGGTPTACFEVFRNRILSCPKMNAASS